jgi:hypothetical protein
MTLDTPPNSFPKMALSVEEARLMAGMGRTLFYTLLGAGKIPAYKLNRRTLVLKKDLETFLSQLDRYPTRSEV